MMKNTLRKVLFLTLFVLVLTALFVVGASAATLDGTENAAITDDATAVAAGAKARLGDNAYYTTLQNAITAANAGEGGTITMLADADYGKVTSGVSISQNITIDGGQNKYTITANIVADFYRPAAGVTFTLKNLTMTATTVDTTGQPKTDDIGIIYIPNVKATFVNIENCTITSTNDVALQAYRNNSGAFNVTNSTIFGGRYAVRFNNSDHALNVTNSTLEGGLNAIYTKGNAAMKATITNSTLTSGIIVSGTVKVTLVGNTVLDGSGAAYAAQLTSASNALTVTGNAKIKGMVKVDAGVVNFGNTDAAFAGTQIIRKVGHDYYFCDTLSEALSFAGGFDGIFTYSSVTADTIKAQYYIVSEASGVYTVTGKINIELLDDAIAAANAAKQNVVIAGRRG